MATATEGKMFLCGPQILELVKKAPYFAVECAKYGAFYSLFLRLIIAILHLIFPTVFLNVLAIIYFSGKMIV